MHADLLRALEIARAGNLPAAIATAREFSSREPASVDALQVLSLLLMHASDAAQAAQVMERAIALAPAAPHIRNNFANILIQLRHFAAAADQCRKAVELNPAYLPAWVGLACALLYTPDSEGAIAAARRGLELDPSSTPLAKNLALALDQAGRLDEALEVAAKAHKENLRSPDLHSLYLMLLNYTDSPAETIAALHRRFGTIHASRPTAAKPPDNPDRPLHIGILSADLRTHSVAYFLEPLLENKPTDVSITCFSLSPSPADETTRRLRAHAAAWHDVAHLDDAQLYAAIQSARIDILLELMGHSGGNRLAALADKPAPIIVSAIGYPNTTGLSAIDFRLVDSISDPPGSESLSTEHLLRIDPCFLCYRPPAEAPEPAFPQGPIAFGSFNAAAKIGRQTAQLWSAVLNAVPGSRLILKSKDLTESCSQTAVLDRLTRAGISRDRINILSAAATTREHLSQYSAVHIALDAIPYNGTTTTCEALYMGVPVVSLAGDRHSSRVGTSLLAAVGHPEWVAQSPEQFVSIAAELAKDPERLNALRQSLRPTMRISALCDAPAYAARVFAALREQWRANCRPREEQP